MANLPSTPLPVPPFIQTPGPTTGDDRGHRFNIDAFKSSMARRGVTRGFFFKCRFFPSLALTQFADWLLLSDMQFVCRAATLPSAIVQPVELKYHTRSIKLAGAREVQPFTCTFFNTSDGVLRSFLLWWQESVSTLRDTNLRVENSLGHFYGSIQLDHYSISPTEPYAAKDFAFVNGSKWPSEHEPIARYEMTHVWPSTIGAAAFAFDNEEFQTFDATFEHLDLQMSRLPLATTSTSETFSETRSPTVIPDPEPWWVDETFKR